jgi:hypothetical protein
VKRDLVIVTCAISAGIHAALAPEHFREGTGAGLGFLAAAIVLAVVALALTVRPEGGFLLATAGAIFAGLIGSYVLAATTGLPLLHPAPEPVTGLAVFTKTFEAVGLFAAVDMLARGRPRRVPSVPIPLMLTVLVGLFSALVALAVSNGHQSHVHHQPHSAAHR